MIDLYDWEYPEFTTPEQRVMIAKLVAILNNREQDMQTYCYHSRNPGIPETSYEYVIEDILHLIYPEG